MLDGHVPDEILTPHRRHHMDRWPERLGGRRVRAVDTYGKHLFIRFDGLALHSHLGMTGAWSVAGERRRWPGAWLLLRVGEQWVAQLRGPSLELMTDGRTRFDQRLAALGPDVLATTFDAERFLQRLREDDPTRAVGEALLDQRNIAGIGNIWKSEGCWEAGVDPGRPLSGLTSAEAMHVVEAVRPRMLRSGTSGPRMIEPHVYGRAGRPCPRCGTRLLARRRGDDNRATYWCPGCQK